MGLPDAVTWEHRRMRDVKIDPRKFERLVDLFEPERAEWLAGVAAKAREELDGRVVWNVNATASGGGVAEMLQALLAYSLGAGVDTRWLVLDGTPEFFKITKRIHNLLHGSTGDGGDLGEAEHEVYDSVLADNADTLGSQVSRGDIVLLHDPQTAGMVEGLQAAGAHVIWRSHVGKDVTNEQTDLAWQFLHPYVDRADAVIFSRMEYVPETIDRSGLRIIMPSLDPFTAKNADLAVADVAATLARVGLVDLDDEGGDLSFERRDGTTGTVRGHDGLLVAGDVVPRDARVVLQVSRWDRLKDMAGVLKGFADHLDEMPDDAHLVLVGPDVYGVSDDPEGADVLDECVEAWKSLSEDAGKRVHLVALPMDDVDENAHIVNAIQRHATVVVQKSLVEGFGLTVTEPMWKGKPVIASKVGGIQDQIVDGESGLLLPDPTDLDDFAETLARLLGDQELADRLGRGAYERVKDKFLGDRHLSQYVDLITDLIRSESE
jgi:trehalose synthase